MINKGSYCDQRSQIWNPDRTILVYGNQSFCYGQALPNLHTTIGLPRKSLLNNKSEQVELHTFIILRCLCIFVCNEVCALQVDARYSLYPPFLSRHIGPLSYFAIESLRFNPPPKSPHHLPTASILCCATQNTRQAMAAHQYS